MGEVEQAAENVDKILDLGASAEEALAKIHRLISDAYKGGFTAGYQQGFEKGVLSAAGFSPKPKLIV
jgi:flagellar biosynthesis/type III secretory pathway protein FliH